MHVIKENKTIPISLKAFVEIVPKNLYESLGRAFDISIEVVNVTEKDVVALVVSKGQADPLFYNMAELYLKYVDKYECSIDSIVEELSASAKWYASEIERDDDLEIESES